MAVYRPRDPHQFTIVFLHDQDCYDYEFGERTLEVFDKKGLGVSQSLPSLKWIFPSAGAAKTTLPDNDDPCTWFEVATSSYTSGKDGNEEDEEDDENDGLTGSIDYVVSVITKEIKLVGESKVILGGVGQGCAVAVHALLETGKRLGGFVGAGGWTPKLDELNEMNKNNKALQTPIFLTHCKNDRIVSFKYGEQLRGALMRLGAKVQWTQARNDVGGCEFNAEQVERFLQSVTKSKTAHGRSALNDAEDSELEDGWDTSSEESNESN